MQPLPLNELVIIWIWVKPNWQVIKTFLDSNKNILQP